MLRKVLGKVLGKVHGALQNPDSPSHHTRKMDGFEQMLETLVPGTIYFYQTV